MNTPPCSCSVDSFLRIGFCPLHRAAPDLLDACEVALKVVSEIADIDTQNRAGWAHKQLQEAIDQARK